MRKIILIAGVAFVFSCNKKDAKKHPHDHPHTMDSEATYKDPNNPLNKLTYASNMDFACNMDVSKYGVSDTLTYKGKLYGFCSTVCKNDFMKKPDEFLEKNQK